MLVFPIALLVAGGWLIVSVEPKGRLTDRRYPPAMWAVVPLLAAGAVALFLSQRVGMGSTVAGVASMSLLVTAACTPQTPRMYVFRTLAVAVGFTVGAIVVRTW